MNVVPQVLANGVIAGASYALVAVGFSLVCRAVRFFHLAHGAVYVLAAYVYYALCYQAGVSPPLSLLIATGAGAAAGFVMSVAVFLPMRRRHASALMLLLASFGILVLVQSALGLAFGYEMRLLPAPKALDHSCLILGASLTGTQLLAIGSMLALLLLVALLMHFSRLGRALRAVADDALGAQAVGISATATIVSSFAVSSALAGVAGVLASLNTAINPNLGFAAVLKGILAAILGGSMGVPGAVAGGLSLGLIENVGVLVVPATWKDAIAYGVLILLLLARPLRQSHSGAEERGS